MIFSEILGTTTDDERNHGDSSLVQCTVGTRIMKKIEGYHNHHGFVCFDLNLSSIQLEC